MHDLTPYLRGKPLSLKARFKPRSGGLLLSLAIENAWEAKLAALHAACETAEVTGEIMALLRRLYPAKDMAVLAKYRHAGLEDTVSVRIYNPKDGMWKEKTLVRLPEPVVVPIGSCAIYAGGPRWSETTNYGVKPEARAQMSEERWQALVAYHNRANARRLPDNIEAVFVALGEAYVAYRAEYNHQHVTGQWTWAEIADSLPVAGAYIRALATPAPRTYR